MPVPPAAAAQASPDQPTRRQTGHHRSWGPQRAARPPATVPPTGHRALTQIARLCAAAPTECECPGAAHWADLARVRSRGRPRSVTRP